MKSDNINLVAPPSAPAVPLPARVHQPVQQQPPGPAILRACEQVALGMPAFVQDLNLMAWLTAAPATVGILFYLNGDNLAAASFILTSLATAGSHLYWQVFYPPNIFGQLFNRQ